LLERLRRDAYADFTTRSTPNSLIGLSVILSASSLSINLLASWKAEGRSVTKSARGGFLRALMSLESDLVGS
jgi:hypothetical protein